MFNNKPVFNEEGAVAKFFVSGSDSFVLGHFPSDAIFPGVLSLHCMKTLSDQYIDKITGGDLFKTTLKRITYIDVVRPGDVLNIVCQLKKKKSNIIQVKALIEVDGIVKSKSTFVYEQ